MRRILFLLFLAWSYSSMAQKIDLEKISDSIYKEADMLYRSEMASWYGSDIYMEKFKDKPNREGYLSYTDNGTATCIFFSKGDNAQVIATFVFDSTYNVHTARVDGNDRPFTARERDLYEIRQASLREMKGDTLFKWYKNTSFNLIPVIKDNVKKVYILTGTNLNDEVIFGNDYLIVFDKDNKVISKKKLHHDLLPVKYNRNDTTVEGGIHTHMPETGEFITATDVCTIRLYEKIAGWKNYTVVSQNYVSLYGCENDMLIIITADALKRIADQTKEKKKKKKEKD